MSYILDALRRADAERQLGRAPDLHAQPLPAAVVDERGGPTRRPLAWLAGGLAAVAVGLLAVWWAASPWRASPPATAVTPAAPVVAAPAAAPAPTPATPSGEVARPESAPVTPADDAAPSGATVPAGAAPAPTTLPPLPPPTPPRVATPAVSPPAVTTAPPPVSATPVPPAPTPATASTAPVPPLRERPDLQRELPPIVFGGSVYSQQASARIVVLNGRVFREGETIMPGLVVDEIRPRGAVLRWREQRFSLP